MNKEITLKEKHPAGLYILFFTEMWERFSYYGMRSLLYLYLISSISDGGLGWSNSNAGQLYGLYSGLVYLTPLLGGYLADKFLGYRTAVFIGGIIMALGHTSLAMEKLPFFYTGLGLLIIGNGLFKPNISSMVGKLYPDESKLKDSAYTIFYMGINLGAFLGSIICGALGEFVGWNWGFGAAGIGMVIGLTQLYLARKKLGDIGLKPDRKQIAIDKKNKEPLTKTEKQKLGVIVILSLFSILFFMCFEQAGSSMNLFAYNYTNRFVKDSLIVEEYKTGTSNADSIAINEVQYLLTNKSFANYSSKQHDSLINTTKLNLLSVMKGNKTLFFNLRDTITNKDLRSSWKRNQPWSNIHSYLIRDLVVKRNYQEKSDQLDKLTLKDIKSNSLVRKTSKGFIINKLSKVEFELLKPSTWFQQIPASWFQAVNALLIIALAPIIAMIWLKLGRFNPNGPIKFAWGLFFLGLGFFCLVVGAASIHKNDVVGNVSMIWLLLAYLCHTIGELCLSPVGLSFVSKLSPVKLVGLMFGVWFAATAIGEYISGAMTGHIDAISKESSISGFYMIFVIVPIAGGLVLVAISPWLKKWMHGVK